MRILIFSLLQLSRSSSDSSSAYLEQITAESFFSLSNPLILSFLLLLIILSITFIFYRYVIIPMRVRFIHEKESELLKHSRLMSLFAELDPDPVFRFDLDGNIILSNQAGLKLSGSDYIIGKNITSLIPELKEVDLPALIKEGKLFTTTTSFGEKYFQFTLRGTPELSIGQMFGSDVTELKLTEQKLSKALKEAQASEQMKSNFLAQMSHEIRTPLNSIIGYNDLIKDVFGTQIPDNLKFAFLAVENSSKRLYMTIDKLLIASQLHTGKYDVHLAQIDLHTLLKKICLDFSSFAEEKGIQLKLDCKTDDTLIFADQYSIHHVFQNLIENGLKYTEKGSVEISIWKNASNNICVDVKDTGIGISKDYLNEIFSPFSQEESGYGRSYEGTGLGLTLTKKFVELNNGQIHVTSEKNIGSTFTIIFKK